RRTTIALQRALSRLVGLHEAELRRLVRVSYAKVAEFQRRGAIHFHAVICLDASTDSRRSGPTSPRRPLGRRPRPSRRRAPERTANRTRIRVVGTRSPSTTSPKGTI